MISSGVKALQASHPVDFRNSARNMILRYRKDKNRAKPWPDPDRAGAGWSKSFLQVTWVLMRLVGGRAFSPTQAVLRDEPALSSGCSS